jgi:hypothetical protein
MKAQVRTKSPFILVVAAAFFLYQLLLLSRSFEADYLLAQHLFTSAVNGNYGSLAWLVSELIGEAGVIIRFAGACIFLAFATILLAKKSFSVSLLRKAVLLEGIYYLFNLPFIVYLLSGFDGLNANFGAALSYLGQLLLVTPIFLKLYFTLKKPGYDLQQAARWIALAIIAFTFALWVKHFALALYALPPFTAGDAVLMVGFFNSAVTLLAANVLLTAAFMPLLKKQALRFNSKLFGAGLILLGVYAAVFLAACTLSPAYLVWVNLVDYWIIVLPILALGLKIKK